MGPAVFAGWPRGDGGGHWSFEKAGIAASGVGGHPYDAHRSAADRRSW
ncbi:MAG: hypothetical protein ACRDP8_00775 [Actinopolymorphaceae bacterium]